MTPNHSQITAPQLLHSPAPDVATTSRIGHYLSWLDESGFGSFRTYDELWLWSVDDLEGFWYSIWQYFDLDALSSVTGADNSPVLTSQQMPGARWFPQRTVNYAEAVLRMPGRSDGDVVVLAESQSRPPIKYTAAELREAVARARHGLVGLGIGRGDRVVAYAPNVPETMILMLAAASLGAVFSSCAPEFGSASVVDRWSQIQPRVMLAVDGYAYGGRPNWRGQQVQEIRARVPSIEHVVWLPYLGPIPDDSPGAGDLTWAQLTAEPGELSFVATRFDEPLYVLYSSGTTGLPKPIVHGHGGITVEHLKTLALHLDLGVDDRFFWFTTTGWMMWNIVVSGLAVGSAIVLFDGDPASPDLDELWRLADRTGTSFCGTSATFIQQNLKTGVRPRIDQDGPKGRALASLRAVGSTGSPLSADGFRWVFTALGPALQIISLAGGTDVCTGFLGSTPLHPIVAGEIACRHLGCKVEAFDGTGLSVVGQLGELVVTAPMPSMPVGLWGDTDGSRYLAAYFDTYPGVWRHGDWLTIGPEGRCTVTGRSDATLNRGGVRLGTAEFYAVVETLDEVKDSLVIHLEDTGSGPGQLILFVVPTRPSVRGGLEPELRERIRTTLRQQLSPRHAPDLVIALNDLPRTLSGKKVEVPVKRILTGTPVHEAVAAGSLANPAALDALLAALEPMRTAQ